MIDNYNLIKENNNTNFVINDIELFVDPTSISIHKENLEYSYKTLRSKGSTKVASGNGALHLQLNLIFSPEMIIQLHRLICQIRNIPFVYIKNEFIERSIGLGTQTNSCHFTVFGFALNNHQSSPGSFVCQIDLRYFNTQPYSNTVEYLHDYKYISKDGNKTYKYTHGVYDQYSRIKVDEVATNINSSSINFNDSKNIVYQKLNKNTNPYKNWEYVYSHYDPRFSNAYKRYSNYIQYQSLKENFGIEIKVTDNNSDYSAIDILVLNRNLYNSFESSKKEIKTLYDITDDEHLEFNKNLSYAILSKALDFRIYFKEFKRETFSPDLLREFRKSLYKGVTKDMTYKEAENKKKKNYENLINYERNNKSDTNRKKSEHRLNKSKEKYYFLREEKDIDGYILHYPGFDGIVEIEGRGDLLAYSSSFANQKDKVFFKITSDSGKEIIEGRGTVIPKNLTSGSYSFDNNILDMFHISNLSDVTYTDNTGAVDDKKFLLSSKINETLKPNENFSNYQIYTGRSGYDNIFEKINGIVLDTEFNRSFLNNLFGLNKQNQNNQVKVFDNNYTNTILTSFGGNFNHIISSIPISGQPYPTHQFLGSIEPTYHFSFIGSAADINKKNVPKSVQDLEFVLNQCVLQAKTFSAIPDASNIAIDSIITRLLGTYKEDDFIVTNIQNSDSRISTPRIQLKPSISLHSSELFTIEGSPNAVGYNVRLSESKHYIQEEIKLAVTTEQNAEKYLKKYSNILRNSQYARKKGLNLRNIYQKYEYMNWNTKNYTSDSWYLKSHRSAKKIKPSEAHDKNAYHLCLLLDEINFYLGDNNKIEIFSTYRGETDLLSSHSVGSATDVYVEGISSLELAAFIELLLKRNKITKDYGALSLNQSERSNALSWIGMGVYGNYSLDFFTNTYDELNINNISISDFRKSDYLMKTNLNYFLHIDLNLRVIQDENSLTKRNATSLKTNRRRWVGVSGSAAFRTEANQTASQAKNDFWNGHGAKINYLISYVNQHMDELKYKSFESDYQIVTSPSDEEDNDSLNNDSQETDDNITAGNTLNLNNSLMLNEIENENIFNEAKSLKEFLKNQEGTKFLFEKYNRLYFKDVNLETSNDLTLYEKQIVISTDYTALSGRSYDRNVNQLNLIKGQLSRFKNITIETDERVERVGPGRGVMVPYTTQQKIIIKVKKENYKKERKINKDLLNNFQALASILLIEPYLYLDVVEQSTIEEEMNRIISELFDIDVIPLHYNYLESNFLGTSHLYVNMHSQLETSQFDTESNFSQKQKNVMIASELAIILGIVLAPISINIGIGAAIFGAINFVTTLVEGFFEGVSDDALLQLKRVLLAFSESKNFQKDCKEYLQFLDKSDSKEILEELKKSALERIEQEDEVLYKDFLNQIDQSDTVFSGIQNFSEKIIYNTPLFKKFVDLSTRLKTSSAVRRMIVKNTSGGDFDKYRFNGLSDRLLIQPLEEYMQYLFMFPMREEFFEDEDLATEVFYIDDYNNIVKGEIDRKYFNNNNLIDAQIYNEKFEFTFFKDRKDQLKQLQNQRIAYLKNIAKALLEDSIILNKEILEKESSELLSIFDGKSVFELLETNAYPDIKLPKSPEDFSSFNENPSMHPMFFIKDFNTYYENDNNLNTFIDTRINNAEKIVTNSKNFMDAMRNGAVFKLGNQYSSNLKNVKNKETFKKMFEDNDFLTDTYEYPNGNVMLSKEVLTTEKKIEEDEKATLTNIAFNTKDPNNESKLNDIKKMNSVLMSEFKDIRNMFGSKLGYKRRKNNDNLNNLPFKNNPLELENYNPVEISRDSSKGITTVPSLKNAFPTFRLYLVEEDSIFSDRLTAYDDFFSYNSVISFSIENNRNLPAATAKIQLQNLSGILDGSRKGDLVDTDIPADIDEDSLDLKNIYRKYADSVVLRHGINVQLRAGYDSNTNELDILISGRITDISYGNNNTICNIIVQSFGVELDTKIKGANAFSDNNNHFLTTHHLLSHAIMSPELKHFGRRKVGRKFQTSEAMEPSLDLEDYSNSSYFDLRYTRTFTDVLSDNSVYLFFLLGAIPIGKVGGVVGKKLFNKYIPQALKGPASRLGQSIATFGKSVYDNTAVKAISYVGVKTGQLGYKIGWSGGRTTNTAIKTLIQSRKGIGVSPFTNHVVENKRLIQRVSDELKRSSTLSRIINKYGYGNRIISSSPVTNSFLNKAEKLIVRELGYENASKLGFINQGILSRVGYGWNVFAGGGLLRAFVGQYAYAIPLVGAAAYYGGFVDSLVAAKNFIFDAFETQQKDRFKLTQKLLLSPQDDNIFSPDPKLYMHDSSYPPVLNFLYQFYDATILNYFNISSEDVRKEIYESSFFLSEKRLDINKNENLYKINGQTVWKIFKDMSYRHPGYVFGIRPYGNSMEYRMFFGLPNQRYFSKQVTNNVIDRLNKIEEGILNSSEGLINETTLNILFPIYNKNQTENKQYLFSTLAIDEYLRKTKDRFTPYRQYHYITAENNIISNDIVVSGHDLINSIKVHYQMHTSRDGEGSDLNTIEVSSLYKVNQHNRKEVVLNDPNGNIKGIANAFRWGMGALLERSKKLYQGSLLILGNTKINTNDVIILKDNITNMHGPLEVDYTIHSFDFQTGFISEIGISALVTGNESLTYPTYNAMIEYEARRELFEKFSSYRSFQDSDSDIKDTIKSVVEDTIEKTNRDSAIKLDVEDNLTDIITNSVFDEINYRKQNNLPNFVTDVTPENADAIAALTSGGISRDTASQLIKTSSFIIGAGAMGSSMFTEARYNKFLSKGMVSSLGKGKGAFLFALGSFTVGMLTDFGLDKLDDSYKSGNLGKNYFKKAIFSSMKGGNNIQLYPLVRDGMPLLAGGFEEISDKDVWENVYGNIYNSMSNAVSARVSREKEYDEIGRRVLEMSETDDDWSFATEILSSDLTAAIFGDETRRRITGWYLSDN